METTTHDEAAQAFRSRFGGEVILQARPGRVLGREHVGDPSAKLALYGLNRRSRPVARHRAGITEAEVDVIVAVDARQVGADGTFDEQWPGPGPADHPVHRHAVDQ